MHELLQQIQKPNTVELSVTLMQLKDKTVLNNTSKNLNSTTFTDIVYNPYSGLDWSQEMHAWIITFNQVFKW